MKPANVKHDVVSHPAHYTQARAECVEIIEDLGLGYHLGNALKYIWRAGNKGKKLEDLKKARWYLNRYIELVEGKA